MDTVLPANTPAHTCHNATPGQPTPKRRPRPLGEVVKKHVDVFQQRLEEANASPLPSPAPLRQAGTERRKRTSSAAEASASKALFSSSEKPRYTASTSGWERSLFWLERRAERGETAPPVEQPPKEPSPVQPAPQLLRPSRAASSFVARGSALDASALPKPRFRFLDEEPDKQLSQSQQPSIATQESGSLISLEDASRPRWPRLAALRAGLASRLACFGLRRRAQTEEQAAVPPWGPWSKSGQSAQSVALPEEPTHAAQPEHAPQKKRRRRQPPKEALEKSG